MKEFFLKMLNSNDPTNSKVFGLLLCLTLITILSIYSLFNPIQIEVLYTLTGLAAAFAAASLKDFKQN